MRLLNCLTLLVLVIPASSAQAEPQASTVSVTGSAFVERPCEVMRLQVDLLSRGPLLTEAMSQLKARAEKATAQLKDLGALPASIKLGTPKVMDIRTQQQRQMQQMVVEQLRSRGRRVAEREEKAQPVTVGQKLTAEWKLDSTDAEQLLVRVHDLKQKITDGDLSGFNELNTKSEEDEELAEELGEMAQMYNYDDGQSRPGQPVFMFVARFSDDEKQKAMADAYQSAQKQATQLSKAAGRSLGTLVQITSHAASNPASSLYAGGFSNYDPFQYQIVQQAAMAAGENSDESISLEPDLVRWQVSVSASFAIE